jgi:mono/diheme cytochrome c family protein
MRSTYAAALGLLGLGLMAGLLWAQEATKSVQAPTSGDVASQTPGQLPAVPHQYNVSAEERDRKNPAKFNAVSVERGKKIFLSQCAMCHGTNGAGKGDLAQELKITLPDFTKPESLKRRTDGELFKIIGIGNDTMPGQEKRLTDPQRWNIVNYLRALGGGAPEKATGKEPEENIIEVPQDRRP